MRDYSKISPAVWQSERFRGLPSDDARFLFLYLLTNQHQNSAGCYRLPEGYACTDLRWQPGKLNEALQAIEATKLIRIDHRTQEVLIEGWFRHNAPMNQKHYIGTRRIVDKIHSAELRKTALEELEAAWQARLEGQEVRPVRDHRGRPLSPVELKWQ